MWTWGRFDPAAQRRRCFLITVSSYQEGICSETPRGMPETAGGAEPLHMLFFHIRTPRDKV